MSSIVVQLNPDVSPTGSDLGIVNAARKSFGRRSDWGFESHGAKGKTIQILKDKDKRLLEFLARGMSSQDFEDFLISFEDLQSLGVDGNGDRDALKENLWKWRNTPTHDTPFNHGFFSFEVKAPIFTRSQLVKHEYLITSEYSRRYITDDVEFYKPDIWRKAADDVKQGSSEESVSEVCSKHFGWYGSTYDWSTQEALKSYTSMIGAGVAPEQARMVLPQSLMTSWTWSGTLGAFANMCRLRLGKDAQYEARIVAQGVYEELKKQFPVSAPLLVEGVL